MERYKIKMVRKFKTILQWEAPEFKHYHKNSAWYLTLLVLAVLFIGYLVYRQDWFGAISLVLIGIFIVAYSRHKPEIITIKISDVGIHIGNFVVPYTHIRHFWIVHNHRHQALNIETTAYFNHILTVELEDQDPDEIREILLDALPENSELSETLSQRVSHRFKF